jgi:isovaleryl-CoA dehydrogenase
VIDWIAKAQELRKEVLEPAAAVVDETAEIPESHFDLLVSQGLYGVALGSDNPLQTMSAVGEILVSGCLATAFVWAQHHGTLLRLATSGNESLKAEHLSGLRMGTIRAGVSGSGYASPQRPLVRAHRTADGYRIEGCAPFVTGWGMIDVVGVTAYDQLNDSTVTFLVSAAGGRGLSHEPLHLAAANASRTVSLKFDGLAVADSNVMHVQRKSLSKQGPMSTIDRAIVRINGSLALGLSSRCLTALDELGQNNQALTDGFINLRKSLNEAVTDTRIDIHEVRAQVCRFAVDVSAYFTAVAGSKAVRRGGLAERTAREANFALVCTATAEIRAHLLASIEQQQSIAQTSSEGFQSNGLLTSM